MFGDMRIWEMVGEVEDELLALRAKRRRWLDAPAPGVKSDSDAVTWVRSVRLPRLRLTLEVGRLA